MSQASKTTQLLTLVTLLGSGCAPMAGRVATEAVEQPLEQLAEEHNLANIEAILASPQVQTSIHELSRAMAEGLVEGMLGPQTQARVDELMGDPEEALRERLEPAVASMMRTVVAATMDEVLAEERRETVRRSASELMGAMVATMMNELGEGLQHDVAPALASAINEELGPAMVAQLEDPRLRAAAGAVMHQLAYEIVLGTNAGVAELTTRAPAAENGFLAALGRNITIGWAATVAFVVALAIVLIVLIVLLARGSRQRRHLETDARRREDMLMSLVRSTMMRDTTPEERRELLDRLGIGREGEAEGEGEPQGGDLGSKLAWRGTRAGFSSTAK
ncbi:MAG: hypothetical protein R6X02_35755 [Enhygromyxa sp.]